MSDASATATSGVDQEVASLRSANQQQEPKLTPESSTATTGDVRAGTHIQNPSLYARMSEPCESFDEANARFEEFFEAVRALREEYRIRDVALVVSHSVQLPDGSVQEVITDAHNGDVHKLRMMYAWALGAAEANETRHIESIRESRRSRGAS